MNKYSNQILVLIGIFIFCNSAVSGIEPTSGYYAKQHDDITVKVIGGNINWERSYERGQWKFNQSWASLVFEIDSADGSLLRIIRGGDSYEKLDSAGTIFKFGPRMKLRKNDDGSGWTWTNRNGNYMTYDASGRSMNMGNEKGFAASFVYSGNRLIGVKDANGSQVLTLSYDAFGNIDRATDHSGRFVRYHWSAVNLGSQPVRYKLDKVTDVRGHDWDYQYQTQPNQNGYVEINLVKDPEGRETHVHYGSSGRVNKTTNALGRNMHYTFDYIKARKEFFLKSTYPGGKVIESWFERDGELKRRDINGITLTSITEDLRKDFVKDAFGRVTTKEYDEFRNLIKTINPDGSSMITTFDVSNSNVLTRIDEQGVLTQFEYLSNGQLEQVTEASGTDVERKTRYTYDAFGQVKTITQVGDALTEEAVIEYFYDTFGNVTKVIDAEGHETEYQDHDALGNAWTVIDGRDKVWTYTYDAHGNLTSSTNPLQHTTSQEYDKVGNRIKVTYPDNHYIEFEYDGLNRLIKETNELQHEMTYEYDLAGNQVKQTDQVNRSTINTYDLFNRISTTTDAAGNVTTHHYPSAGEPDQFSIYKPKKIDYPTFSRAFKYDSRGRTVEQVTTYNSGNDPKTETIKFAYDLVGNQIEVIDAEQRSVSNEYNELNQLVKTIEPYGIETRFTYDDRGNLLTLTDGLNQIHTFTYDKLDQKLTESRPLGQVEIYTYDANGNMATRTDAKGQLSDYTYDDANRNTQIEFYTAQGVLDQTNEVGFNTRNSLVSYDDGLSQGTLTYDAAQQKMSETIQYDGQTFAHSYTYHPDGNKATFTGMDGITYGYFYNQLGMLNNVVIPNVGNITYQDFIWNQPQKVIYPGGTERINQYDGMQRLLSFEVKKSDGTSLMAHDYTYTAAGNLSQKNTEHGNYVYGYDDLNRLTSADYPNLTDEIFTYDAMGNRKTDTVTGTTEWSYNLNNQLLDAVHTQFEYDANGNQTIEKDPQGQVQRQYLYNTQNRLSEIRNANGDLIASYYYDPFGRRLSKTVVAADQSSSKTYFHYNDEGYGAAIGEGSSTSYLYNPLYRWSTAPILTIQNSTQYFYQNDQLGTPQLMHDISGVVVNAKELRAFGGWENTISTHDDMLGFPGQYTDSEKKSRYNLNREYDISLGRYNQNDPIGIFGGLNLYAYALLNPVVFHDNRGLSTTLGFVACDGKGNFKIFNDDKQCTRPCTQEHEEVHMPFVKNFFNGKRGRPTCRNGGMDGGFVPNRVMPALGRLDSAMYRNALFEDECKAYKVSKSCLEKLIKECDDCTPIAKKQLESVKSFLQACPGP